MWNVYIGKSLSYLLNTLPEKALEVHPSIDLFAVFMIWPLSSQHSPGVYGWRCFLDSEDKKGYFPENSLLSLIQFNIFISDQDSRTEDALGRSADDIKLVGMVDTLESKAGLLFKWTSMIHRNWPTGAPKMLCKDKCQVLPLEVTTLCISTSWALSVV